MIRKLIKKWLGLYDLHDLRVGAHCGCCGHWISEAIVEKDYAWDLCRDCEDADEVLPHILPNKLWPKYIICPNCDHKYSNEINECPICYKHKE